MISSTLLSLTDARPAEFKVFYLPNQAVLCHNKRWSLTESVGLTCSSIHSLFDDRNLDVNRVGV